jgi:hypothetical protein
VNEGKGRRHLLDHVQDAFVLVQPKIMIGNGHLLKSHLFRVLEERVRTPHVIEPGQGQQSEAEQKVKKVKNSVLVKFAENDRIVRERERESNEQFVQIQLD